jgi:hypothetical protein
MSELGSGTLPMMMPIPGGGPGNETEAPPIRMIEPGSATSVNVAEVAKVLFACWPVGKDVDPVMVKFPEESGALIVTPELELNGCPLLSYP